MQVGARVTQQPALDLGRLVGGVVVEHEMHSEIVRQLLVDLDPELLELLGLVAGLERTDHLARRYFQRREQRRRAVPYIVMRSDPGGAGHHGQDRPEAVGRLDLGLLVYAEHHGPLSRIEVGIDDVAHLFEEERIRPELEGLRPVWLRAKGSPDMSKRGLANAHLFGHATRRPVRRVLRFLLQGLDGHRFDLVVADRHWAAGPGLVTEPVEAAFDEAAALLAKQSLSRPEVLGDGLVRVALCAHHHDARPHRQRLCALARVGQALERGPLFGAQYQLGLGLSPCWHAASHRRRNDGKSARPDKTLPDLTYFLRICGSGH